MKRVIVNIVLFVVAFVMLFGIIVYLMRLLSNTVTPLTLHTPKPGVTCAAMVTGDGVALSCWKD